MSAEETVAADETAADEHEEHPVGAMTVGLLFLLGTAGVWLFTYFLLLSRG